jgi:hypothetical protein
MPRGRAALTTLRLLEVAARSRLLRTSTPYAILQYLCRTNCFEIMMCSPDVNSWEPPRFADSICLQCVHPGNCLVNCGSKS